MRFLLDLCPNRVNNACLSIQGIQNIYVHMYVLYLPTYCVATLSPKAMFTAFHFNLSLPLLIVQENGQNLKPACASRFRLFYATIILKYHQEHRQNGNSHPHELQHGCQGKCFERATIGHI